MNSTKEQMLPAIIFDLDGTLIDSQPGIFESLKYSLSESGFVSELSPAQVPIGPPLLELVKSVTNTQDSEILRDIVVNFKRHYDLSGFKASLLFDGVLDFLVSLSNASFSLYLATNKRLVPTLKILDYFSIGSIFVDVYAIDSHGTVFDSKTSMLDSLLSTHSLGRNAIYVGDRVDDYLAATSNSLGFFFPRWGYLTDFHNFPDNVSVLDLCSPERMLSQIEASPFIP